MYKYEAELLNTESGITSGEDVYADGIVQALMQIAPKIAGQPIRVTAIFEVGGGYDAR